MQINCSNGSGGDTEIVLHENTLTMQLPGAGYVFKSDGIYLNGSKIA